MRCIFEPITVIKFVSRHTVPQMCFCTLLLGLFQPNLLIFEIVKTKLIQAFMNGNGTKTGHYPVVRTGHYPVVRTGYYPVVRTGHYHAVKTARQFVFVRISAKI